LQNQKSVYPNIVYTITSIAESKICLSKYSIYYYQYCRIKK